MLNIISFAALVIALTIHEYSHAKAADILGDPTPRANGRLSLNPLRHLDPIGTILLLFAGFGWGKPVQVDPYNFRNPRRDEVIVALAGPASNLILAIITALVIRFTGYYANFLYIFVALNITLAIFNLMPIPPLDGSKLLINLLPFEKGIEVESFFERYGYILLIALVFLPFGQPSFLSLIMTPITTLLLQILLG